MPKTPKVRVPLRLDAELAAWADEYAERRRSSRTAVYEAGLAVLRELSRGGVPDLPDVSARGGRVAAPESVPSAPRVVVEPPPAGVVDDVVSAAVPASVLSRAERFRRATQGGSP